LALLRAAAPLTGAAAGKAEVVEDPPKDGADVRPKEAADGFGCAPPNEGAEAARPKDGGGVGAPANDGAEGPPKEGTDRLSCVAGEFPNANVAWGAACDGRFAVVSFAAGTNAGFESD
jgi:hypothetical protein